MWVYETGTRPEKQDDLKDTLIYPASLETSANQLLLHLIVLSYIYNVKSGIRKWLHESCALSYCSSSNSIKDVSCSQMLDLRHENWDGSQPRLR